MNPGPIRALVDETQQARVLDEPQRLHLLRQELERRGIRRVTGTGPGAAASAHKVNGDARTAVQVVRRAGRTAETRIEYPLDFPDAVDRVWPQGDVVLVAGVSIGRKARTALEASLSLWVGHARSAWAPSLYHEAGPPSRAP